MPWQKGQSGRTTSKKNMSDTNKSIVERVDARLNEFADIIAGLYMANAASVRPENKVNSLEFIRKQVRSDVLTLDRLTLSRMYMQFGLCQSVAEVPVFDAYRNGVEVMAYEMPRDGEDNSVVETKYDYKPQGVLKRLLYSVGIKKNEDNSDDRKLKNIIKDQSGRDQMDDVIMEKRMRWDKIAKGIDSAEKEMTEKYMRKPVEKWKIDALKLAAKRYRVDDAFRQANIWKRVFGGGAIIINLPDSCGAPDTPLDLSKIKKGDKVELIVADCWEIMGTAANVYVGSPAPEINWASDTPFSYYGVPIHKSRVLVFKGKEIPSVLRPIGRGWGLSFYESLCRTLTTLWKSQNARAEFMDDAKTDVLQFKGLAAQATNPMLQAGLQKRIALAQSQKNYAGVIALDSEDKYAQKQVSFAGFADLQEQDRYDAAADTRIVLTKLYGMTPSGFSDGDNDRASYEDMVKVEVQNPDIPNLIRIYEVLCRTELGETLSVDCWFPPLSQESPNEDIEYKTKFAKHVIFLESYGAITQGQRAEALNSANVLPGVQFSPDLPLAPDPALTKFTTNPLMNK